MSTKPLVYYPSPNLNQASVAVVQVDGDVRALVKDLAETMYANSGIALSAPQIGDHRRVVVLDVSESRNSLLVLVNPEIVTRFGQQQMHESCLSIPGVYEEVQRADRIEVQASDRRGAPLYFKASGLLSSVIQHEIDHLDGILFVDRVGA